MPRIASLEAFERAAAGFEITGRNVMIEPSAGAAVRRSLDRSGLLLLGEIHGVQENPLLIRALMQAFGLTSLALEWPEDLAPTIRAFLARQRPGVREIRISYGGGGFYNGGPRQLARRADPQDKIRLYQHDGE